MFRKIKKEQTKGERKERRNKKRKEERRKEGGEIERGKDGERERGERKCVGGLIWKFFSEWFLRATSFLILCHLLFSHIISPSQVIDSNSQNRMMKMKTKGQYFGFLLKPHLFDRARV